jgi:hypothetical protein
MSVYIVKKWLIFLLLIDIEYKCRRSLYPKQQIKRRISSFSLQQINQTSTSIQKIEYRASMQDSFPEVLDSITSHVREL